MKTYNFTSHNSEETMNFASNLASKLNVGDVVVLSGELGAGKTKFTEGFLKYFGLDNEISSPTFSIVNEYKKDDLNIYHFDVYRLEDVDEFYAIGGEEYFSSGICTDHRQATEIKCGRKRIHHLFQFRKSGDPSCNGSSW